MRSRAQLPVHPPQSSRRRYNGAQYDLRAGCELLDWMQLTPADKHVCAVEPAAAADDGAG